MKKIILHPLLFAIFPALSIYLNNTGIVTFNEVVAPIIILLFLAILLWSLLFRLLGSWHKSGFLVSIFLILFFSFGHLIPALHLLAYAKQWTSLGFLVGTQLGLSLLLLIWFTIMGTACIATMKSSSNFLQITNLLNVMSIAVIVISIGTWSWTEISQRLGSSGTDIFSEVWEEICREDQRIEISPPVRTGSLPDIYYIILDGYGRGDILKSLFDYDNTEFLSWLEEQGFYIAERSHSNYSQTALSLASSLNSMYLDPVVETLGEETSSRHPMRRMIHDNLLFHRLRDHGYVILAFSSCCTLTDLKGADIYITHGSQPSEFQNELLNTTPIPVFLNLPFLKSQFDYHREHILYTIHHLKDAAEIDAPVFVFAHVMVPHPPFVFGASGEPLQSDRKFDLSDGTLLTTVMSQEEYVTGYRDQLTFINSQIKISLQELLLGSDNPPIVILQGDHGPGSMLDYLSIENSNVLERMSILNAYYFPDQIYKDLYPEISPVNTFRVLLNRYFNIDYAILEDRGYFSTLGRPYSFQDVTSLLRSDSPW
ncbi:MAG: sulfatase-like hydrolase/transferase [Anaerolineales bacterium]|nr:sulfatase-like hydrolase/transferase [Anaerolineales bacterium]